MKLSIVLILALSFLVFLCECAESAQRQQQQDQQRGDGAEAEKRRRSPLEGSPNSRRRRCVICPRFPVCRCNVRRGWRCVWVPRTCFTCGYYKCVRDRRRFDGGAGGQGFEVVDDMLQATPITGEQGEGDMQEWSDDQGQNALIEENLSVAEEEQAPLVGEPMSGQAEIGAE